MRRPPRRERRAGVRLRVETEPFTAARVERSLTRILRENPLCALATIDARGRAHVNTAYFAYSGAFELFFLSDASSVHAGNLRRNPRAAIAVYRSPQTWGGNDRGAQLFGIAREARGGMAARARQVYARRFPAYTRWFSGVGVTNEQSALLKSYRFYRFLPLRFKVLDEAEFQGAIFIEGTFPGRR